MPLLKEGARCHCRTPSQPRSGKGGIGSGLEEMATAPFAKGLIGARHGRQTGETDRGMDAAAVIERREPSEVSRWTGPVGKRGLSAQGTGLARKRTQQSVAADRWETGQTAGAA